MSTIRWSPVTSMWTNGAATTVVLGTLGSGKTFFLLNVAANEIGMGRRVIAIDPKNDFNKLLNISPYLDLIDVNKIHPGALNPFTFLDNIDTATLLTIIEIMVGKLKDDALIDITPIVTDFVTKYKREGTYRDMQDVADYLFSRDSTHARAVGTMLKVFEDNKYGPLLFTREEDVKPLRLSDTRSFVITLHGMALPQENRRPEDYTADERLTAAITYILTKKLRSILVQDSKIATTIFFDEAHMLFSNPDMAKLIDEFMSMGRSLNTATVLASQGVQRFPDISRYVASKFMFKNSLQEAERFLQMFDSGKYKAEAALDIPSVATSIAELKKGQCFFIDLYNRSGFVQIKSIYDISLLTSNPLEKIRKE